MVKSAENKKDHKEEVGSSDSSDSELEGLSEGEDDLSHRVQKLKKRRSSKHQQDQSYAGDDYSGIIFVSRLPHGFEEKELTRYFSQFGDLKDARLARNKKSGNTRHYGFIEFINKDDAKVAQETMNNYLLMNHLIQVRLLPKDSKIEKLYRYKQRSFQVTPVKKSTEKLKEAGRKKHEGRVARLKKAGIDFKW